MRRLRLDRSLHIWWQRLDPFLTVVQEDHGSRLVRESLWPSVELEPIEVDSKGGRRLVPKSGMPEYSQLKKTSSVQRWKT